MEKTTLKYLLEKELSYKLVGIFINISQKHGYLLKEKAYYRLLIDSFVKNKIRHTQHPKVKLINNDNDAELDFYYPDFLIENKIILEIKAQNQIYHDNINQLMKYLSISQYELGYIVNFGTPKAQFERRIYTNDRKRFSTNNSRMAHECFHK
jgi:GxxExxY protein